MFYAGAVYEETKSFSASFYLGGGLLLLGGFCHLALYLPCIKQFTPPVQQIIIESIEEIPNPVPTSSGVQPEFITMEEVIKNV